MALPHDRVAGDGELAVPRPPPAPRPRGARFLPLVLPLVLFAAALLLPAFIFAGDPPQVRRGLGPDAWPRGVLALLASFSLAWALRDLWVAVLGGGRPSLVPPREDAPYARGKAVVGLGLIVLYGWAIPVIGFTLATTAFVAVWCLFGGLRSPLAVAAVSVGGTMVLLWVFMGLALMPLDRGQGPFGDLSIGLLRLIGVY